LPGDGTLKRRRSLPDFFAPGAGKQLIEAALRQRQLSD
jgi:hypothetical protein